MHAASHCQPCAVWYLEPFLPNDTAGSWDMHNANGHFFLYYRSLVDGDRSSYKENAIVRVHVYIYVYFKRHTYCASFHGEKIYSVTTTGSRNYTTAFKWGLQRGKTWKELSNIWEHAFYLALHCCWKVLQERLGPCLCGAFSLMTVYATETKTVSKKER